jgi:hypothetical protein
LAAYKRLCLILFVVATCAWPQPTNDAASIEQAVIREVASRYGIRANILRNIDLTGPFHTTSQWRLIVAKQPDKESSYTGGSPDDPLGAVITCFVKDGVPDCGEQLLLDKVRQGFKLAANDLPYFHLFLKADLVFAGKSQTRPLLWLSHCPSRGMTGNCTVTNFLIDYEKSADRFRVVFFNETGRNNNEETRFIGSGPLQGSVILAEPTIKAPSRYWVEVFARGAGANYVRILRYRTLTGYNDGNPLAVIDSEMIEILRRMGKWKPGHPFPKQADPPDNCAKLELRRGVLWCKPNTTP